MMCDVIQHQNQPRPGMAVGMVQPVGVQPTGPLPPGWAEIRDPNTGQMYYHNEGTGETTWTRPISPYPGAYTQAAPAITPAAVPVTVTAQPVLNKGLPEAGVVGCCDARATDGQSAAAPATGEWETTTDPATGRQYRYNTVTMYDDV